MPNKLMLSKVVVVQAVKLHTHEPGEPCTESCGSNYSVGMGLARYTIDIATGECVGEVIGDGVHVSEVWWKDHCARVGARVQERLKDIKL